MLVHISGTENEILINQVDKGRQSLSRENDLLICVGQVL